jgi:plasmid maintenance system antidote protein VapI
MRTQRSRTAGDYSPIGEEIVKAVEMKGWTLTRFAAAIGTYPSQLSYLLIHSKGLDYGLGIRIERVLGWEHGKLDATFKAWEREYEGAA